MSTLISSLANRIFPRLLPKSKLLERQIRNERRELAATATQKGDPRALLSAKETLVEDWLNANLASDWENVAALLDPIRFGSRSGAVNPGDQRALYYIARSVRCSSILEVGTHVAASTGILALALRHNTAQSGTTPRLTTVDIMDVNDPARGAWKRIGCDQSPTQFMRSIKVDDIVKFVTQPATDYLTSSREKFDVIFLDGDHSASGVYREIPAALGLLNPGGVILLHDYFPGLQPLWADGAVVPGPQLAVERLRDEKVSVTVKPLGALPWPTKQGSNVSSLAMLCRVDTLAS